MAHVIRRAPATAVRRSGPGRGRGLRATAARAKVEYRELRAIEAEGNSPLTMLIVLAHVGLFLAVVVGIELTLTFAFYFGWI
jgi:hypothetical protein